MTAWQPPLYFAPARGEMSHSDRGEGAESGSGGGWGQCTMLFVP